MFLPEGRYAKQMLGEIGAKTIRKD
jgi:hypothetical protein